MALRKKPRPADPEPEPQAAAAEPPPPAAPPPVIEHLLPVAIDAPILCPRSPEDVIHNVILRQLADDLVEPPEAEPENPALTLLKQVQQAKDRGQPLANYANEAAKVLQGLDAEEKLTEAVVRHVRVRRIRRQMESDEFLDRFLHRCVKRGDLSPREAVIFKQMNWNGLVQSIKELLDRLEDSELAAFNPQDISRIDWKLQVSETASAHAFDKMTPQGREIVRKITMTARRKLYQANVKP